MGPPSYLTWLVEVEFHAFAGRLGEEALDGAHRSPPNAAGPGNAVTGVTPDFLCCPPGAVSPSDGTSSAIIPYNSS
jgi:hypothetical protein